MDLLQVNPPLNGFLGRGLIVAGFAVLESETFVLVDQVQVTGLTIVRSAEAIDALVGVGQLLRGLEQGIPGPGVIRILHAGVVEDLLVVDQGDRVVILRDGVVHIVVGVEGGDAGRIGRIVILKIHGEQGVGGHILEELVGMHPEHIGHRAAHGGRFQLGPVLIPGGDLNFDLDIGMGGHIGFRDGGHAGLLVIVPEGEGDGDILGARKGDEGEHHAEGQQDRKQLTHWGLPPYRCILLPLR